MKTIAFFGHREIFNKGEIKERIINTLKEVIPLGFSTLLIGCHGDFDSISLSACLNYRKNYDNTLNINVVLTNLYLLNRDKCGYSKLDFYKDRKCETVVYDIEEVHFKKSITFSNKRMVDNSDLVICYVDMQSYKSGAKTAINYAIKQNKKIINLFNQNDRTIF